MDINPYEAPRSEILHAADGSVELAARLRRLAAVVIDTICLVLAWLAAEWVLSLAGIEFAPGESDEVCETSYRDRGGKYQGQTGVTLPRT